MSHYSIPFTAEAWSTILRITDISGGAPASDGLLDNVLVTFVPEPSAMTLAMAALFFMRRWRWAHGSRSLNRKAD